MADQKIAKEDITRVNEAGQTVVIVPAGQPIPDGVDVKQAQTEDKARRSSRGK